MSLTKQQKDDITGWTVTLTVHALLLLLTFYLTIWQEKIPPKDIGQGIEMVFDASDFQKGNQDDVTNTTSSVESEDQEDEQSSEASEEAQSSESISGEEVIDPLASEDLVDQSTESNASENTDAVVDGGESSDNTEESSQPVVNSAADNTDNSQSTDAANETIESDFMTGQDFGGGNSQGDELSNNGKTYVAKLGAGGTITIPKGWELAKEPRPKVEKNGTIVIEVKFDAGGKYIPNSAKCIEGNCLDLFNPNLSVIEQSLQSELELVSDGKSELSRSNTALFKFIFKAG